ncbi:MAG TPA: hypothetical protein DDY13_02820 [Cytophagales bacterium]|nr:hypothetical protein [Cytophagales bacterium]
MRFIHFRPAQVKYDLSQPDLTRHNYHNTSKEDPFIEISVKLENQKAKIEVKDNRRGIARNHLPKIFNMFYRASEGSQGSGLGFYIDK